MLQTCLEARARAPSNRCANSRPVSARAGWIYSAITLDRGETSLSHESRMNLVWISLRRFRIRLSEGRWPSRTLICGLGNGVRILTEFPCRRYSISLREIRSSRSNVSLAREIHQLEKERERRRLNSINSIILRKRSARDNGPALTNRFLHQQSSSMININIATMRGLSPRVSLNLFLAPVYSYVRNGCAPMFMETFVTRVTSVRRVLETSVSACIGIARVSIIADRTGTLHYFCLRKIGMLPAARRFRGDRDRRRVWGREMKTTFRMASNISIILINLFYNMFNWPSVVRNLIS